LEEAISLLRGIEKVTFDTIAGWRQENESEGRYPFHAYLAEKINERIWGE